VITYPYVPESPFILKGRSGNRSIISLPKKPGECPTGADFPAEGEILASRIPEAGDLFFRIKPSTPGKVSRIFF
jgi:hypothetical protein